MAAKQLSYAEINRLVLKTLEPPGRAYWVSVALLATVVAVGLSTWMYQVWTGLGVTGLRQPVMWAIYITNFVFWVGIAH
jgi:Ni/Fe-hydrogenase subunit HybB-like protein